MLDWDLALPFHMSRYSGRTRRNQPAPMSIRSPGLLQVLGGIEWRFGRRLSLFVEYKLSCAMIRGDLVGGGKVTTNLCTHQLLAGPAVHLRARDAIPASP